MDEVPEPAPDPQPSIENGGGVEPEERCSKKAKLEDRCGSEANVEGGGGGELRRVAEIVLVLSTMSAMRGGRKPTDVEVELMREARTKLAQLCQGIAPKDIVAREAIGAVIDDLGLNAKFKDQRLGSRTPKMSIAERYSHAKWKMEESKKLSAPSTTYTSQPLQTSIGGAVDNRVPTHTVRMIASDKPSHAATPSTGTVMSIPPHVSVGSSAALQYQSTSNEVRPPVVPGVISSSSSQLGRISSSFALPKVEHSQFKVDGGSNGPPYVQQVQANSSANQPLANAPTWSMQTQSSPMARSMSENKVPTLNSAKVEVAADVTASRAGPQITTDKSFRPFTTQTTPLNLSIMHQPLQVMNRVQGPMIPSHADIAKVVQKVLLPKLPDHPTWTPPSRDYMNKALTCQLCELTVNEVDTVLLCDACEKGFHLKCLQPSLLRGIHNKLDWYCMNCLSLSGGKPLPPKYGRVMRSSNTPPKLPSNTDVIQPSSEKSAGSVDPQVSQLMLTTNGSSVQVVSSVNDSVKPSNTDVIQPSSEKNADSVDPQVSQLVLTTNGSSAQAGFSVNDSVEPSNTNIIQPSSEKNAGSIDPQLNQLMLTTDGSPVQAVSSGNDSVEPSADSKTPDMNDIQVTSISSSIETIGEKPDPNISVKSLSAACSPSTGLQSESSQQINSKASACEETSESEALPIPKLSEPAKCENLQSPQDFQVEQTVSQDNAEVSSDKHVNSSCMASEQKESHGGENLTYDSKRDDLDVTQANFTGGSETNAEGGQHSALSSDTSHAVEWIGDVVQVVDENKFYQSCSVNGVTYRLLDHALFPSSQDKLIPSKLQSMWEDCKTGLKWVKVTKCYFPDDLPGNIGHPCISEVNEVYESNSDRTEMVGSIQGPCEVLPSDKFKQENDRRCQLENEASARVQPIFLCRWFYDELKSLFQPVTS